MHSFFQVFPVKAGLLLGFAAALVCSLLLTLLVRTLALRFGWARGPESARHVHLKAIPRLGGVAIYCTVLLMLSGARLMLGRDWAACEALHTLWKVLMPGSMLFLVGVVDDWKSVPAKVKLMCQVGAGVWLYLLGYSVAGAARWWPHALPAQAAGLVATVVWVVWITNAVNLIDGLDGLAAGSSLFTALTLFLAAVVHGNHPAELGTVIIGGAIVGFLRYNFNPASIFLGDGGSLFLGFMLSAVGLIGNSQEKTPLLLAVGLPVLAFGLPLTEVVLSVSRRFLSGKRLFDPDRMHIHHRLLDCGMHHRSVVLVLYGVSALFGALALLLVYPSWAGLAVLFVTLCSLAVGGIGKLRYPEFAELGRLTRRALQQRRVITNSVRLRNTVEELNRASTVQHIRAALEDGLPTACFRELRLSLSAMRPAANQDLLALSTAKASTFVFHPAPSRGDNAGHAAKLVLNLASPRIRGSLELVVNEGQDMLLNMSSIFTELHPALNEAIARLEMAESSATNSTPVMAFPLRVPMQEPAYGTPHFLSH